MAGCIDEGIASQLLCMLGSGMPPSDPFVHGVQLALRALLMQVGPGSTVVPAACHQAAAARALLCLLPPAPASKPRTGAEHSQGLRHRARIFVPRACCLIGVTDVTGALGPEEVGSRSP